MPTMVRVDKMVLVRQVSASVAVHAEVIRLSTGRFHAFVRSGGDDDEDEFAIAAFCRATAAVARCLPYHHRITER